MASEKQEILYSIKLDTAGTVEALIGALAHRGPDGQGLHVQGNVALAHNRLAIIDRRLP